MFSCNLSNDEVEKMVIDLINGDKTLENLNYSLNLIAFNQSAGELVQFVMSYLLSMILEI